MEEFIAKDVSIDILNIDNKIVSIVQIAIALISHETFILLHDAENIEVIAALF
jgi:hypothetical protein